MHNLLITGPAALAAAAAFFSLGGLLPDPAAHAAVLSALPAPPPLVASAAPTAAPAFRIRGEWVSVGSKSLDGLGPADSVFPTGQQAGATLAPGLTFTGAAAVALNAPGEGPPPLVVALYAVERPGLAFIVSPPVAGRVSLVVPPGPALDFLPVSALPASCVQRAV